MFQYLFSQLAFVAAWEPDKLAGLQFPTGNEDIDHELRMALATRMFYSEWIGCACSAEIDGVRAGPSCEHTWEW